MVKNILVGIVVLMSLSFMITALMTQPDIGELFRGYLHRDFVPMKC